MGRRKLWAALVALALLLALIPGGYLFIQMGKNFAEEFVRAFCNHYEFDPVLWRDEAEIRQGTRSRMADGLKRILDRGIWPGRTCREKLDLPRLIVL
jgi:hypothetical protein